MNVLIVEDEMVAATRMKNMILEYDPSIQIVKQLDCVIDTIEYIAGEHETIDAIFMDIHLGDGLCFEIFEQIEIDYPIIFTTAYNEYAINAFKVNSIDYLLKPVSQTDVNRSLDKLKKFHPADQTPKNFTELIKKMMGEANFSPYKNRFLVKYAKGYKSIDTDRIAYYYSEDKITFLVTRQKEKFIIDSSLEDLTKILDPLKFFKISRQFIVALDSITDIQNHFNSRLKVVLEPTPDKEVFVSRSHVPTFKAWLDR